MNYDVIDAQYNRHLAQVWIREGQGIMTKRAAWDLAQRMAQPSPRSQDPAIRKGVRAIYFQDAEGNVREVAPASVKAERKVKATPQVDENDAEAELIASEIEAERKAEPMAHDDIVAMLTT
jgi:hypothetical protein